MNYNVVADIKFHINANIIIILTIACSYYHNDLLRIIINFFFFFQIISDTNIIIMYRKEVTKFRERLSYSYRVYRTSD